MRTAGFEGKAPPHSSTLADSFVGSCSALFRGLRSYKNLVDSAQALVMACRKIGVDPEEPANRVGSLSLSQDHPVLFSLRAGL